MLTKSGPEWILWQTAKKIQAKENVTFKWQDFSRPSLDTIELKDFEFSDPAIGDIKVDLIKIVFFGPFEDLQSIKLGLKIPISKIEVGQVAIDRSKVILKAASNKETAKNVAIPGWLDINADLLIKRLTLLSNKNTTDLNYLSFDVRANGKKHTLNIAGDIRNLTHGTNCSSNEALCLVRLENSTAKIAVNNFDFKGNIKSDLQPSIITKQLKLTKPTNISDIIFSGNINVPDRKIDFKNFKIKVPVSLEYATLQTHSEISWKNNLDVIIHKARLNWNGSQHLVQGRINDEIDLTAKVGAVSVEQLSPWIKLENLQGIFYGDIDITGNIKYPKIESHFFVNGIRGQALLQFEGTLKGALKKIAANSEPWQVLGKMSVTTPRFQTEMNTNIDFFKKNEAWNVLANINSGVLRDSTLGSEINSINVVAQLVNKVVTVNGTAKVSDSNGKLNLNASGKPFTPLQQNTINLPPRMQGVLHVSDLPIDFNQTLETLVNSKITFLLPVDSNDWQIGGVIKPRETVVNLDRSTPKLAKLKIIDQRKTSLSDDQYGPEIPTNFIIATSSEKKKTTIPAILDIQMKMDRPGLIRGRGINAEFNGALQIRGNPNSLNWIGNFDVIRGRYEWAGQRFDLSKGYVTVSNKLVSFHGEAQVTIDATNITVIIDTKGEDIDFNLTSVPALPEEEILALLFFGGSVDSLSPLQAIRLAQAVQQIRSGKAAKYDPSEMARRWIGVDDLKVDTTTSEAGETDVTVGVGKYISRRLYLEVAKGLEATSPVEANLDAEITNNILVRGTSKSDRSFQGIKLLWQKVY